MSCRRTTIAGRVILLITYVSLACKFLIPVGYMPAAIGDGWPVKMCHTGLPVGFLAHDQGHHEHDQIDDVRWQTCSFGVCCSPEAVAADYALHTPNAGQSPALLAFDRNSIGTSIFVFHSRAPPARVL